MLGLLFGLWVWLAKVTLKKTKLYPIESRKEKKKKKKKKRETKPRLLRNYRPRKIKCRNHQSMRILAPKMPCER